MSKLIVVEGACDGMGKSTQVAKLRERFIHQGEEVISHHFPSYGTYHGAPVEHYLKGDFGEKAEDVSSYFVNALYGIDRAIAWKIFLKEQYELGKIILLDRYTTSSLIYQTAALKSGVSKKDFIDYVIDFEYNKLGVKEPDKVIFLYADFDLITKFRSARKSNEGINNDIHETDFEFMKRVYDCAMFIADYLSWEQIKCDKDESMKSIDEIHEEVYSLVKRPK